MGVSFTWREYGRLIEALGLKPTGKGTRGYKGFDSRTGQFRYTQVHEHPGGIDTRTLEKLARRDLGFASAREMIEWYFKHCK